MKAAAVICECNPFHYGHRHVFAEAHKKADCVIAVMSGNFVQRGEAAVFDKYARARAVLRGGADLVVELPFPWSSASAEFFAQAGVSLASSLRADVLVCGASGTDAAPYRKIADELLSEEFRRMFEEMSAGNMGAAVARQQALSRLVGEEDAALLARPNDILATEYAKAIRELSCSVELCPIRRISAEEVPAFLGASAVREILAEQGFSAVQAYLPPESVAILQGEWDKGAYAPRESLEQLLFHHLRTCRALSDTSDGTDGVLERLKRCADEAADGADMFVRAATKKYTHARFRRAALFHMTDVTREALKQPPLFTHLLAASEKGCAYLSQIRKTAAVQILTKPSAAESLDEQSRAQYEKSCEADRLYTLCTQRVRPASEYVKRTPFIQK